MEKELKAISQNLGLQPSEIKPSATYEEQKFAVALQDKKVKDLPEIKLREALRYCIAKVGLRADNFPEGVEKSLLLDHIFTLYGNHTPAEIRLAFDMAIAGKLDLKPDEVKCYENFSCAYFSTIMNAYRSWAHQVWEQEQKAKKPPEIEDKPDLEQIEKEYQEFLKTPLAQKYKPNL